MPCPFRTGSLRALLGLQQGLDLLDADTIYVVTRNGIRYYVPCIKFEASEGIRYFLREVKSGLRSLTILKYHALAPSYKLPLK